MQVDVAVIGTGTAGPNARCEVKNCDNHVLMIENQAHGTTRARFDRMPSKLLISAADAVRGLQHASHVGVHPGSDLRIDGAAAMQHVPRGRDRFVGFVVTDTQAIPQAQRLGDHACFTGPTTLRVPCERTSKCARSRWRPAERLSCRCPATASALSY